MFIYKNAKKSITAELRKKEKKKSDLYRLKSKQNWAINKSAKRNGKQTVIQVFFFMKLNSLFTIVA